MQVEEELDVEVLREREQAIHQLEVRTTKFSFIYAKLLLVIVMFTVNIYYVMWNNQGHPSPKPMVHIAYSPIFRQS